MKISLVTACKGRLSYLKESLPTWLALEYEHFDIVVVDYDCPDGTEEYINQNRAAMLRNSRASAIHVVKIKNKPVFNLCDARNTGIDFAPSEAILMIDADVHIKEKSLLETIGQQFTRGTVFFSNTAVLATTFTEGHIFYRLKYGIERIAYHVLLPTHCKTVGLSGTACFRKNFYQACGKYRVEVNKGGWGSHDIEFYIRYLNHYFYHQIGEKKEIRANIHRWVNQALKGIDYFPAGTFHLVPNTVTEKTRFYKNPKHVSIHLNKEFICKNLESEGETLGWIKREKNEDKETHSILKYNRFKKYPVPPWFKSFYYYWTGINFFNQGEFKESSRSFEDLLKIKAPRNYRWQALFFIARIKKQQNNNGWRYYLKKALTAAKNPQFERDIEKFYLGSFLKYFHHDSEAEPVFKRLINETDDGVLISAASFHLGEIAWNQKKIILAQTYFKKVLALNPNHKKAAQYLG
ncbi:MAG: glycosyltransferase [bacterium]|nr:glycosyltransferase [bacterium]